jgi:hypothetical protein
MKPIAIDPELQRQAMAHLGRGMPWQQVAELTGIPKGKMKMWIGRARLPLNKPVMPNSKLEYCICRAFLSGYTKAQIAVMYRVAELVIEETLERVESDGPPDPDPCPTIH